MESVSGVLLPLFAMFSIIIWVKGLIWLKYHLHFNVKVRAKVTKERVYEVFKWNFVIPYCVWLAIIVLFCFIKTDNIDAIMWISLPHIIMIGYILIWKELFTLFGWRLGEWNTQVPHISFFQKRKLNLIEMF